MISKTLEGKVFFPLLFIMESSRGRRKRRRIETRDREKHCSFRHKRRERPTSGERRSNRKEERKKRKNMTVVAETGLPD